MLIDPAGSGGPKDLAKTREAEQQALVRSAQAWKHELEYHGSRRAFSARRDAQALLAGV